MVGSAGAAPITRESEHEPPPKEAWAEDGFRLGISLGQQTLWGQKPAPAVSAVSLWITPALRLTEAWSLELQLHYNILTGGQWSGFTWVTAAGATFHPAPGLELGTAFGYGGMLVEGGRGGGGGILDSVDVVNVLTSCDGDGLVAQLRASYLVATGQLFATGPSLLGSGRWTRCRAKTIAVENPEPSRWFHLALTIAWVLTWR